MFYAYMWLREDGTPYYVGKGTRERAFTSFNHTTHRPADSRRILTFERASEPEAFETEKELIRNWGRKDLDTGILRNMTEGGEGASGVIVSAKTRQKCSLAHKGHRNSGMFLKGYTPANKGKSFLHRGSFVVGHAPFCNHRGEISDVCSRCGKVIRCENV